MAETWTKMLHDDRSTWPPEHGSFLVYEPNGGWYIGNRQGMDLVILNDEWSAHATEPLWWQPLTTPPEEDQVGRRRP